MFSLIYIVSLKSITEASYIANCLYINNNVASNGSPQYKKNDVTSLQSNKDGKDLRRIWMIQKEIFKTEGTTKQNKKSLD